MGNTPIERVRGVDKRNVILEKTLALSLEGIRFCKKLETIERRIADQLFRSITSIGANVHEAQGAESRADFIHKMKIAIKETEESIYWMKLCSSSEHLVFNESLFQDINEVKKIISKIIITAKSNKSN